jgi:hypothetical protein
MCPSEAGEDFVEFGDRGARTFRNTASQSCSIGFRGAADRILEARLQAGGVAAFKCGLQPLGK